MGTGAQRFYMGTNGATESELQWRPLGKPGPVLMSDDGNLGTKKMRKKMAQQLEKDRYAVSNCAEVGFHVHISDRVFRSALKSLECVENTAHVDTATYVECMGFNDFTDPFILRKFRGKLYCWSEKGKVWGLAHVPGLPIDGLGEQTHRVVVNVYEDRLSEMSPQQYAKRLMDLIDDASVTQKEFVVRFTPKGGRQPDGVFGEPTPLDKQGAVTLVKALCGV
jgi:hypothetical protein